MLCSELMGENKFHTDSRPMLPCHVCGKPESNKRYSAFVCNACRVFFYRAVRESLNWPCANGGHCNISHKHQRSNCFACRLRKCHEAKMEAKDVGKKVSTKVQVFSKLKVDNSIIEVYSSILNSGPKGMSSLGEMQTAREFVNALVGCDALILARNGKRPSTANSNMNMTLSEFVMFPGACMSRDTAAIDLFLDSPLDPNIPCKLTASMVRVYVAATEMMSLMREFHEMTPVDKMRLVQNNALDLTAYLLRYEKYTKQMDNQTYAQYLYRFRNPNEWSSVSAVTRPSYQKTEEIFRETQISEKEMILVRLIAMFHPHLSLSADGRALAIKARMRLIYVLKEYMMETRSYSSPMEIHLRLREILGIERYVKDIMTVVHPFYFRMVFDTTGVTPLGHDLFVRVF